MIALASTKSLKSRFGRVQSFYNFFLTFLFFYSSFSFVVLSNYFQIKYIFRWLNDYLFVFHSPSHSFTLLRLLSPFFNKIRFSLLFIPLKRLLSLSVSVARKINYLEWVITLPVAIFQWIHQGTSFAYGMMLYGKWQSKGKINSQKWR